MKRYFFIVLILFVLLVSACVPAPQSPAETPSLTAPIPPTNSPVPSATATPLPSATLVNTVRPETSPTTVDSIITCVAVAFLPDNSRILSYDRSNVQIFDLGSMRKVDLMKAPANLVSVALSPDGQTLAWAMEDNTIQLVRLSDHQLLHTFTGNIDRSMNQVTKLKFTPDGTRLVSASHDTWVRIWDMDGKQVDAFQPTGADDLPKQVMAVGVSPDGKRLASVPDDGPVKLWDLATHQKVAELGGTGAYDTSDVAFSPDGQFVAADLATGQFLWRVADGRALLGDSAPINSMAFAFSPDGRFLAYADLNNVILSSPDGSQVIRSLEGHQSPLWNLVFSPDGSKLASRDGVEVRIWQVPDGKLLYTGKSNCP